jgi:hypothetical protein
VETLHLLSFVEFTDLLNGCSLDSLVRNAFVILRMVVTACYLHLKCQDLYEVLMSAHETIVEAVEEKVHLRAQVPAADASIQPVALHTDQLMAISSKYLYAQAAASQRRARQASRV